MESNGLGKIIVVGDRVLVAPDDAEGRTKVGLLLPASAVEKEAVQSGRIVKAGPGTAVPDPTGDDDEPWRQTGPREARYIPMQAHVGDYAIFVRKAAVEIKYEEKRYLVVPQGAILVLIRDGEDGGIASQVPDAMPPISDA